MQRSRSKTGLACCASLLALVACTSAPARTAVKAHRVVAFRAAKQGTTAADVPRIEEVSDRDQRPALPVEALEFTTDRQIFIDNAIAVATSSCMAGLGVTYQAPVVAGDPASDPMLRRYGVSDLAQARAYGYHLPPVPNAGQIAPTEPAQVLSLLSGTVVTAPNGSPVPTGGCTAAGNRAVGNTSGLDDLQANSTGIVSRIDADSYQASLKSNALQAIFADWSSCMRTHGYTVTSPLTALDSANLNTPTAAPTEIALATTDVSCKISTHLVSRWAALESPLQRAAIARAGNQLAGYRTELDQQLVAASKLLGQPIPA